MRKKYRKKSRESMCLGHIREKYRKKSRELIRLGHIEKKTCDMSKASL